MTLQAMGVLERAEKYIECEPMSGCWVWTGATSGKARKPCLKIDGRSVDIGRHLYEIKHGPLGIKTTRITCGLYLCVRPSHRRLPMPRGARLRSKRGRPMICAKGHRMLPIWADVEAIEQTRCGFCRMSLRRLRRRVLKIIHGGKT